MQDGNERKIPDDEIDIRPVLAKLYSFVNYPFFLLLSNIVTTLVFIVLAILLAVSLKYIIPKSYTSSFIIRPLDKNERVHLKILRDIQTLLKYKDYAGLASELKIDSAVAKTLVVLQTSNPSLKNPADSVNATEVIITTKDYHQFLPLQNALLNYLEYSPYFFKIRELQKKQIEIELKQVEKDLPGLDSLKELQMRHYGKQTISSQNAIVLNELLNPTSTYTLAMERVNKKSSLLARNVFLDNFQLVKPCAVIRHHTWPPRVLLLSAYLVPAFLVICVVFLHIRRVRAEKRKNSQ